MREEINVEINEPEQLVLGEEVEPKRSEEEEKLRGTMKNVKELLEKNPGLRDNDRVLVWKYWDVFDKAVYRDDFESTAGNDIFVIEKEDFVSKATNPETIMRCARKVRQKWPNLRGTEEAEKKRDSKRKAIEKTMSKYYKY